MSTLTPPISLEHSENQNRVDYIQDVASQHDFDYPPVKNKFFYIFIYVSCIQGYGSRGPGDQTGGSVVDLLDTPGVLEALYGSGRPGETHYRSGRLMRVFLGPGDPERLLMGPGGPGWYFWVQETQEGMLWVQETQGAHFRSKRAWEASTLTRQSIVGVLGIPWVQETQGVLVGPGDLGKPSNKKTVNL
jgi:hypothetical protein